MKEELSFKEQRIRKLTHLYYSKKEIQDSIFKFSKDREICPRYFEGFGKRPDSFQYLGDIYELIKKGATSFHCSEELWNDPLKISTGMKEEELNQIRVGWDLLIDIDSKYIDYSKILAKIVIEMLNFHGIKNVGIKFSGSKGFHIIVPFKAFPKEINGIKTSDMFPHWPRIIARYIISQTKEKLVKEITSLTKEASYIKNFEASKEVIPDIVLISPRHLFRMPYSLHEKTALSSIVISPEEIEKFQLINADPLKLSENKLRNFLPDSKYGEAKELLVQALDWYKENDESSKTKKNFDYKPINLTNVSEKDFPPCIKRILMGIEDGKKRALFVLINLFRSIGIPKEDVEKLIYEWNSKNSPSIKPAYIKSQLYYSYKNNLKPIMPPNCKEFYQGIGVCSPDELCRIIKNPVNYVIKKNLINAKNNK